MPDTHASITARACSEEGGGGLAKVEGSGAKRGHAPVVDPPNITSVADIATPFAPLPSAEVSTCSTGAEARAKPTGRVGPLGRGRGSRHGLQEAGWGRRRRREKRGGSAFRAEVEHARKLKAPTVPRDRREQEITARGQPLEMRST